MIRWGVASAMVVLAAAVLMYFTPRAFADGCEGGDSTAGHNAIAFCCGSGNGGRDSGHGNGGVDKGTGKGGKSRLITR